MDKIQSWRSDVVTGELTAAFEPVADLFESHFSGGPVQEIGAAFSVYKNGEPLLNLWGGETNTETKVPWEKDTTVNVYSSTKALAALCVAILVDRGLISYQDKVSNFWPEFACNGKEETTLAQLMSHQSGSPGLRCETAPEDLLDHDLICKRLAEQEPLWVPGEATAYHPWTYGFLAGEVVRRIVGCSIGAFLQKEVALPLGADAYIGLPESKDASAATLYGPGVDAPVHSEDAPEWIHLAMANPPFDPEWHNQRKWRAAELPAFGGFASADGLARIYSAVASGVSGIISNSGINKMRAVYSDRLDDMMGLPVCWGAGVAINSIGVYGPNPETFGHSGWGGSLVVADLNESMSIAYVCNQMSEHSVGDPRATALLMKVYECLASRG